MIKLVHAIQFSLLIGIVLTTTGCDLDGFGGYTFPGGMTESLGGYCGHCTTPYTDTGSSATGPSRPAIIENLGDWVHVQGYVADAQLGKALYPAYVAVTKFGEWPGTGNDLAHGYTDVDGWYSIKWNTELLINGYPVQFPTADSLVSVIVKMKGYHVIFSDVLPDTLNFEMVPAS